MSRDTMTDDVQVNKTPIITGRPALEDANTSSLEVVPEPGLVHLDPRTHLPMLVITGVFSVLLEGTMQLTVLMILAAVYLAINGRGRAAIKSALFYTVFMLLVTVLPPQGMFGFLFLMFMHAVPSFMVAFALLSLSPSAIMCALSRWHVPRTMLITICVFIRFVPMLGREVKSIVSGIRMRGIFPYWYSILRHPAFAYECFYTPLVVRCLKLSSELAASSELRGIECDDARTTIYHVGFGIQDICVSIIYVVLVSGIYFTLGA